MKMFFTEGKTTQKVLYQFLCYVKDEFYDLPVEQQTLRNAHIYSSNPTGQKALIFITGGNMRMFYYEDKGHLTKMIFFVEQDWYQVPEKDRNSDTGYKYASNPTGKASILSFNVSGRYKEEWVTRGNHHNLNGPSIIRYNSDGSIDSVQYFIEGVSFDKEEYLEAIKNYNLIG